MSEKLRRYRGNNLKFVKRKGHFQREPADTNSDALSTINTTLETFRGFGLDDETLQLENNGVPLFSTFGEKTISAELLAHYLAQFVEQQPQLSSEEKVYLWQCDAVVKHVDDVIYFQKQFEDREAFVALTKRKNKSKAKKTKTSNNMLTKDQYNFEEFNMRLRKDLADSITLTNVLNNTRTTQNMAKDWIKKQTQATRKRATKTAFDSEQEPKTKVRKKTTTKIETSKVADQRKNMPKAKAAATKVMTQNKAASNRKKQEVVITKPLTKRQEQLKQMKIINENKKQITENELRRNSIIVFREDFVKKPLHLDKKRVEYYKNFENVMTTNRKQTNSRHIATTTTATTNVTTTTTTNNLSNVTNNKEKQNSTTNDNCAGVGHQQHVFCNYLGLTGMSTATAVANAVAELSNCATQRRSLRVRNMQKKEMQNQKEVQGK